MDENPYTEEASMFTPSDHPVSPHRRVFQLVAGILVATLVVVLIWQVILPKVNALLAQHKVSSVPASPVAFATIATNFFPGTLTINGQQAPVTATFLGKIFPGKNLFTYNAPPFPPKSCTLTVPARPDDTCHTFEGDRITFVDDGSRPTITIGFSYTRLDLPAQARYILDTQFTNLTVTQETTVPAGFRYGTGFNAQGTPLAQIATQPLHATYTITPLATSTDPTDCPISLPCPAAVESSALTPDTSLQWQANLGVIGRWDFDEGAGAKVASFLPQQRGGIQTQFTLSVEYSSTNGFLPIDTTGIREVLDPVRGSCVDGQNLAFQAITPYMQSKGLDLSVNDSPFTYHDLAGC